MQADHVLLNEFIASHDGELFGELVHRHASMVFGVCRRVLRDAGLAEDATQETFLHLLRHPSEVSGSLVGWLHRVAHGKAVDLVRREAAQGRRKQQALLPEPAAERPWAEISPLLDQAMADLPEELRAVLAAHYLQGTNQADLASQLGISQSTISRRITAGLDALRERLAARGAVHSVGALALVLQNDVVVQVPATLLTELGKMTIASHIGVGGTVVGAKMAGGTSLLMAKVAIIGALVGGGTVATVSAWPQPIRSPSLPHSPWWSLGVASDAVAPQLAPAAPPDVIANDGPFALVSASAFGGVGDDEVVGVGIAPDFTIIVAANAVDSAANLGERTVLGPIGTRQEAPASDPNKKEQLHPSRRGMILRLASDGRSVVSSTVFGYGQAIIHKILVDDHGGILILGDNQTGADLGGGKGQGRFVAKLDGAAKRLEWLLYRKDASDFARDGNGDVVLLADKKLVRFDAKSGAEKWTATWKTYGENRPGGMSVDPTTGVTAVLGYGMTKTGREPYKDPFAYGFDREGKQVWSLWNPDPTREVDSKYGGNGLMADTTGHQASITSDGKFLLTLYADGGNSVCTRDPADPDKPIDANVFKDVFQKSPGHGFKGATKTSVVFRVDPKSGTLEKGTWMCSWISPQRGNGLAIDAMTSSADGTTFVVGSSASGFPLNKPWYEHQEGAYQGGGFLAVFDRDFRLQQSGYFSHSGIRSVASRDGWVVIGGTIKNGDKPEEPPRFHKPFQTSVGNGRDGYIVVLRAK